MTLPHFDHVGLSVADLDAQRRFYAEALDMTETEETFEMPEAQVRTAILHNADGLKLELVQRGGSTPQEFADPFDGASVQGYFHWALTVDDLDAVFAAFLRAGADAVSSPAPAVRPGLASPTSRTPKATCSN